MVEERILFEGELSLAGSGSGGFLDWIGLDEMEGK